MKVVIHNTYGGFGISKEAVLKLRELGNKYALEEVLEGEKWSDGTVNKSVYGSYNLSSDKELRTDKNLIVLLEDDMDRYRGKGAILKIVEIPDDIEWEIEEYDGNEWISEVHRTWS